jgi:NDP-hexose C3-ketoreductase / dTDP-4-oxo-2-deoxy-alpha-D-pentos-2-ene 2,3-reductase
MGMVWRARWRLTRQPRAGTAMNYNKLGRSNMTVSKICLGTMHFGPKATEEDSHRILDKALGMGINFIDTANV